MSTSNSDPFSNPSILGCRFYPYALDKPSWGVDQSELLTKKAIGSILITPHFECDEEAFEQEERACKLNKWVSAEVLMRLHQADVVKKVSYRERVQEVYNTENLQDELDQILSTSSADQLSSDILLFDNYVLNGLSVRDTATNSPQTRTPFYWDDSKSGKVFYSNASTDSLNSAVLSVFLDADFYILPSSDQWDAEVHKAVSELQAPHLEDLKRLDVDGPEYLERIRKAHGHLDEIIDGFMRRHSAKPYGDYQKRIKRLLDARRTIRESNLLVTMREKWKEVESGDLCVDDFQLFFDDHLREASLGLLRAKTQLKNEICVNFVSTATAISGVVCGVEFGESAITEASSKVTSEFLPKLRKSIIERLRLKDNHPVGYFELKRPK